MIVGIAEAAAHIGVERSWLNDAPIRRLDYRKPGGVRAQWRWDTDDLDEWTASRRVEPGHASPFGR